MFLNRACSNIKLQSSRVEAPVSERPSPRSCWSWVGETAFIALGVYRPTVFSAPERQVNFDTHTKEARPPGTSLFSAQCTHSMVLQYQNDVRL